MEWVANIEDDLYSYFDIPSEDTTEDISTTPGGANKAGVSFIKLFIIIMLSKSFVFFLYCI